MVTTLMLLAKPNCLNAARYKLLEGIEKSSQHQRADEEEGDRIGKRTGLLSRFNYIGLLKNRSYTIEVTGGKDFEYKKNVEALGLRNGD